MGRRTPSEVWDGLGDTPGGQGRVGVPPRGSPVLWKIQEVLGGRLEGPGEVWGSSRRSGTGREALQKFWDGSGDLT